MSDAGVYPGERDGPDRTCIASNRRSRYSRFQRHSEPWGLSAFVLYEFLSYDDTQSTQRARRGRLTQAVDDVLSFDVDTAAPAASMETSLTGAGVSLDDVDLLIAATARQHQATFVTADKTDFDKDPIHERLDIDIVDTY